MRRSTPSLSVLGFVGLAAAAVACSATPDGPEHVASSRAAITRDTILANAQEWVTAKLLYCQSANHAPDYDTSCSSTCVREDNPTWDPYRSDCSGFVSWAWGLPAPGRDTNEFAPADTTVSFTINGSDLQPGDALNIPGEHIILFTGWQTVGTVANFFEEPGCSASMPYAHAFTSAVTITGNNVAVAYEGKTFTAIRYTGITTTGGGSDAGTDVGGTSDSGGSTPTTSCYSSTLKSTVVENTCVQSASDGLWYQCDNGSWVVRSTDPAACVAVYPLGTSIDAGADTGSGTASTPDSGAPAATACVTAGGTCVAAGSASCSGGHVGTESCGASIGSECCLPGTTTAPGGTTDDAGSTIPSDTGLASTGSDAASGPPSRGPAASPGGSSAACAVTRQAGGRGDGDQKRYLAIGVLGVVASVVRRRRSC
ncbi:MAG: hypothetical protein ACHREM_19085 [Polyangiales bacterium]